jgi:excisionase family DNA binding protein
MERLSSPRQVAQAVGVSESSLKRWCDRGLIPTVRTAGGHRRLPVSGVVQFLRSGGARLVRPELLGLPTNTGRGPRTLEKAAGLLQAALVEGDRERVRRIVFDLYLAEHRISTICDEVIAPAVNALGDLWQHGQIEVYCEARGTLTALRCLESLRLILPPPLESAPVAVGGTPEGDPYQLATSMAEIVLIESGWNATCLGSSLPLATLQSAMRRLGPRMIWLSVSHIPALDCFLGEYERFYRAASDAGVAICVGGRALTEGVREDMSYSACLDEVQQLATFAEALGAGRAPDADSSGTHAGH